MSIINPDDSNYVKRVANKGYADGCLAKLRALVLGNNKLINCRSDDSFLLRFLHCTNFDVTAAYQRIQDFLHHVSRHPEWYASASPLAKKQEIEISAKAMLRDRDRDGRRIYVAKMGKVDPTKTSPQGQCHVDEIWMESVLDEPETQAAGISVVLDMSGYSLKMFRWLTPSNMRHSARKMDLYPCKEIIYHIVNSSVLVNQSVKLLWPFLSDKIKENVKFHFNDWSSLHEYISPQVLPAEYGGIASGIDFQKLREGLFHQSSEIYERLKYQSDVNK